jgi:hypothetical protein
VAESHTGKPWPRTWTWAIVLALGLFGAHATSRWWLPALMQRLFGQVPDTFAEIPPRPNMATTSSTSVRNETDRVGAVGVRHLARSLTPRPNPPTLAPMYRCARTR